MMLFGQLLGNHGENGGLGKNRTGRVKKGEGTTPEVQSSRLVGNKANRQGRLGEGPRAKDYGS